MNRIIRTTIVVAAIAGAGLGLAACGGTSDAGTATQAPATSSTSAAPSSTSTTATTTTTTSVDTTTTVPDLSGRTADLAKSRLMTAGLKIKVTGDTSNSKFTVLSQTPAYGEKVEKDSTVTVVVGESPAQKTEREAAEKAAADAAAAEAAQAAADADLSTYQAIDSRTWALIVKDPEAHKGEKYVVYGYVTQFDSGTGTSTFRADTDGVQQEKYYDYETNTMVNSADPAQVADVVSGDLLKMYVKVSGALTYSNTMGGSNTVPEVTLIGHELIGHED